MNGNTVAIVQVHAERREMKNAFKALEKLSKVDSAVFDIKKDLLKLNKKAFKRDSKKVFASYTNNINYMLKVCKNFVHVQLKDASELNKKASEMMMLKILPFTENIGKIRGMGSGIVARTKSSKGEDKQMLSFVDTVENLAQEEAPNMKILANHYPDFYSIDISEKVEKISKDARAYISETRMKVIGQKDIKLNANEYFNEGTELISKALVLFDANVNAIKKDLD